MNEELIKRAMKFQIIGFTLGVLLTIIGVAELIPAAFEWINGGENLRDFLACSIASLFFGFALIISNKGFDKNLSIRHTFLLTTLSWILISLAASFPLYLSNLDISFTDAFFESLSGITTTGSTVLSGLDGMSHGILVWRSMIQWIGGIGIIAFAIFLLPFLQIGGMQLFHSESSDKSEKIMPRSRNMVAWLITAYCLLTLLCGVTYYVLGMTPFDAFNHALTTIPTGGYSTHDASFGYFESAALQMAATLFMLMGGIPFILYIKFLSQGRFVFFKDEQFNALLVILAVIITTLTLWLWHNSNYTLSTSFIYSAFNIASVITTTGYATTDYTLWGSFSIMLFLTLTYLGACSGSTTGGLKIMRLVIIAKTVNKQLLKLIYPHGVFSMHYQGRKLDQKVTLAVFTFLGYYVIANVALTIALAFTGLDLATAISGAATAIANVGPGIGEIIGPAGNFSSLSDTAKWLLCAGMLLGRLEIMTVFVLFQVQYWR